MGGGVGGVGASVFRAMKHGKLRGKEGDQFFWDLYRQC